MYMRLLKMLLLAATLCGALSAATVLYDFTIH